MPFKKGQSGNPVGRVKGNNYKINAEQRDFLRDQLRKHKRKFELLLGKMECNDFMNHYFTLMQYVLPKPATAVLKEVPKLEEFIAMTGEERQAVVDEVQESLNKEQSEEIIKNDNEERKWNRYCG